MLPWWDWTADQKVPKRITTRRGPSSNGSPRIPSAAVQARKAIW